MAGLFEPKVPKPIPVVNPADVANRQNEALAHQLASGGTNADIAAGANTIAPGPQGRQSTLTGIG